MGLCLYRRVRILPGLTVNVSKSGPSLSVGVRGAHVTSAGAASGKTVGIPGTGDLLHFKVWPSHRVRHQPGQDGRGQVLFPLVLLIVALILLMAVLAR